LETVVKIVERASGAARVEGRGGEMVGTIREKS
jgi:hypothetical protein